MSEYRISIQRKDGALLHGEEWVEIDQDIQQMHLRMVEFTNYLRNHCYQLLNNGHFVGNFKRRDNAMAFAQTLRPVDGKIAPILLEVFPTTPQECLDAVNRPKTDA